jgi:DNA primase
MIPQRVLDDILDRVNIVEIVSHHIPLKKAGRNFKANCPFHHEKTPSFMVSPDKQIYHCFGCGAGGNIFSFLMKYERMEFIDAVTMLAKKAGVELPTRQTIPPKEASFINQLFTINELAAAFYHGNLLNQERGKYAFDYLKKRNVSHEVCVKFKLGYSLNSWDALIRSMKTKGINAPLLAKAGLAIRSERDGSYYDRFRNRLVFPIFDVKGKIIAFGARVLDEGTPKYLNSPETPIYTKGLNLYGLHTAKSVAAREHYAIIVEGYLDLLSCYQAGIEHSVATCGTALTVEQSRLLRRFTNDVVMVYDADLAGQAAALRNLDVLISEGLSVRVVSLPGGHDPDSFINAFGVERFKALVAVAKDLFSYKLALLGAKYTKVTPEGKAKIVSEMLPTLWRVPNAVLKTSYMRKLAQDLDVDENALRAELKKIKGDYAYRYQEAEKPSDSQRLVRSAEKILISLMLEDPQLIESVKQHLGHEIFRDVQVRKIVKVLYDFSDEAKDITPHKLISYLDDEGASDLICELASDAQQYTDKEKNLHDCIKWIKQDAFRGRLKDLHTQIHLAQSDNDQIRLKELIAQYNNLVRNRRD